MYSERFLFCVKFLIEELEKGYNPDDPSMHGISQAWLDEYHKREGSMLGGLPLGVKALVKSEAIFLYFLGFWQKYHLELLPRPMDLVMLCCLVHRETVAREILRAVLKFPTGGKLNLSVLATLGAWTLQWGEESRAEQNPDGSSVWCKVNVHKLYLDFMLRMVDYYLGCEGPNKAGHLNRMEKIKEAADKEVRL